MIGGPKLSSFKIGGPKLQKIENRGTKTAIKPKYKHSLFFTLVEHKKHITFTIIFIVFAKQRM